MHTSRRTAAALAATFALLAGAAVASGAQSAAAAPAEHHDDFNGDGYRDLVVAAPAGTVNGVRRAGYAAVLYGSANGLSTAKRKVVSQATAGVPGSPEAGDGFGTTLASADFDRDGYADLAVGVTGEDLGGVGDTGYVEVLYGSANGLTGDSDALRPSSLTEGNRYGTGLAAGDWFHDGAQNLAILAQDHVELYGGWGPGPGAPRALATGNPQADFPADFTPTGLVSGDFEGDGSDDLVITGSRWYLENLEGHCLYLQGSPEGFTRTEFAGGPVGVAGDVDKDGADELVVGDPTVLEHGQWDLSGGAVEVWYGANGGPGAGGQPERWEQGTGGVPGAYELEDRFGSDVALGDVDGDGHPDLAIGAEGEAIGDLDDAGATWLLRGGPGGLTASGAQTFNQDTANVPGVAETGDLFGSDVRLVDADRDGRAGLVAGSPGENYGHGYAWVLQARSSGLTATGSWTFDGADLGANGANARFPETIGE